MNQLNRGSLLLLGWFRRRQRRIDFVRDLERTLGLTRREAFDLLNSSLERVTSCSVPVDVSGDSVSALAQRLASYGVDVCVVALPPDHQSALDVLVQRVQGQLDEVLRRGLRGTALEDAVREISNQIPGHGSSPDPGSGSSPDPSQGEPEP